MTGEKRFEQEETGKDYFFSDVNTERSSAFSAFLRMASRMLSSREVVNHRQVNRVTPELLEPFADHGLILDFLHVWPNVDCGISCWAALSSSSGA